MEQMMIRPDMRTFGGESNDIMLNGQYVGTITLVYREKGRMTGSISLDNSSLRGTLKLDAVRYAKDYIQSLIDAYEVDDCQVIVTAGHVEDVIATEFEEQDIDDVVKGEGEDALEITDEDLSVVLTRDDGDVLTYDVYCQSMGGLPIASATVDIANEQLSGYLDFRRPLDEEEREAVAVKLMQELDKEKDYEAFNVTMMHNNEWIDEMLFEQKTVH